MVKPVAVVTGASSGIGRAVARALSGMGAAVYGISRRAVEEAGVVSVSADVTDPDQVRDSIRGIIAREGRLDVAVFCAGMGISGAVEFTDPGEARHLFDVNYMGVVNCLEPVLGQMRRAKCGRIVIISSVAGAISIPFQAHYSASKAALNALAMALDEEVKPYGVRVTSVMPGDIRTGFTASRKKLHAGDDEYGGRIARSVGKMEKDEEGGMSAETAGRMIALIALKKRAKPLCALGFSYKALVLLSRVLPVSWVMRLVGRMYAR